MAFSEYHAFFRVKGEVRIANLSKMDFPDTSKFMVDSKEGGYVVVDLEYAIPVVERATEISPLNLVMLEMSGDVLEVRACDIKGKIDGYMGAMKPIIIQDSPGKATVDGKMLLQALKQCDTPRVRLTSGSNVDPLKLESGRFTEYLWQRYWEK